MLLRVLILLVYVSLLVKGHARIKEPQPLAAAPDGPAGNYYNAPLKPDGSEFPCKGLHKNAGVDKRPTKTWEAGQEARFVILGHGSSGGEGSLAAHSGGSCQASLSFDNGVTWKVLHTYQGGCPRGVQLGSNIASTNQVFTFFIPVGTRAGIALFSWTWIAVTGNRNEFYQNCASVNITGSGTSTLDDLPDMFVGDLTLKGQIGPGECRSTANFALQYPNPGNAITITQMPNIPFKKPSNGNCFAKGSNGTSTAATPSPYSTSTQIITGSTPSTTKTQPTTTKTQPTTTKTQPTTTKTQSTTTKTQPTTSTRLPSSTSPIPGNSNPPQCTSYTLITDKTRHATYPHYIQCDNAIFKSTLIWVRFSGAAGTRLAKGPMEPFHCGTQGTGWYKGSYPSSLGATTSGTVCYSWPNNPCMWSNQISITLCNGYYVFALRAPPACYLRYCTI